MSSVVNVFGMGRVGLVTAFGLSRAGHRVRAIDVKPDLVETLSQGQDPFGEPMFGELLSEHQENIDFSLEPDSRAKIHFICVPTPFDSHSLSYDLSHVLDVAESLADSGVICVRSTVSPGACQEVAAAHPKSSVVYMPEFYREGHFAADWLEASKSVLAGEQARQVQELLHLKNSECEFCSWEEAEILKMSSNLFHGLKVTFANEIGRLATRYGARPSHIMDLFCSDTMGNISSRYFKPGFAYGGPCLVKDIASFAALDRKQELGLGLAPAVQLSNSNHIAWVADQILNSGIETWLVLGGAFKPGGTSVSASPVLELAKELKSRSLTLFATESCFVNEVDEILPLEEALCRVQGIIVGAFSWSKESLDLIGTCDKPIFDLKMSTLPEAVLISREIRHPFVQEL